MPFGTSTVHLQAEFWDNLRVEILETRLCRKFQRSRRRSCRKFALKLQDENFEILKKGYLFGRSVTICKRAARSKEEFQRRQGSDCADKGQLISLHLLRISKSCRALENMCEGIDLRLEWIEKCDSRLKGTT